ncbi:hypothetical protein CIK77_06990 [Microbacterium sp. JB110]|nr:hypothetical protein CIK77_06990 [Microbacterium sp. JB110]
MDGCEGMLRELRGESPFESFDGVAHRFKDSQQPRADGAQDSFDPPALSWCGCAEIGAYPLKQSRIVAATSATEDGFDPAGLQPISHSWCRRGTHDCCGRIVLQFGNTLIACR